MSDSDFAFSAYHQAFFVSEVFCLTVNLSYCFWVGFFCFVFFLSLHSPSTLLIYPFLQISIAVNKITKAQDRIHSWINTHIKNKNYWVDWGTYSSLVNILYYEVKIQLVKHKNVRAYLLFPVLLQMLSGHSVFKLTGHYYLRLG